MERDRGEVEDGIDVLGRNDFLIRRRPAWDAEPLCSLACASGAAPAYNNQLDAIREA
jgi:hypothetical protein